MFFEEGGLVSVFNTDLNRWKKVYDWGQLSANNYELNLQPGEYDLVYFPNNKRESEYTQTKHFKIQTGQVTQLSFRK